MHFKWLGYLSKEAPRTASSYKNLTVKKTILNYFLKKVFDFLKLFDRIFYIPLQPPFAASLFPVGKKTTSGFSSFPNDTLSDPLPAIESFLCLIADNVLTDSN
jgi:hypothetical protein